MPLDSTTFNKYLEAGKIAAEVREDIRRHVEEGMSVLEICNYVESETSSKGGKPAFPCNVSINDVAAHYTARPQDDLVIPKDSIVKIDLGVHVDGFIADTAVTVSFNPEWDILVETAEEALETAVSILRADLSVSSFGAKVENTIKLRNLKPISNLTGHLVGRYTIHAGKSLPNVYSFSVAKIKEGEVYATEPFVTTSDGGGNVRSGSQGNIFRFNKPKKLTNQKARKLLDYVQANFRALPFTERWLEGSMPREDYRQAFQELLSSKAVVAYPVFLEVKGKPVAQAEHTVIIKREGCVVTTRC